MKIKNLALCAVSCSLLCVLSPIIIPIGAVGITLSTLVLGMICLLFKTRQVFVILLIYILLGGIGLPVFSGFGGGIGHILGPTGGFIIGYFPFSAIIVLIIKLMPQRKASEFLALFFGYIILYVCGVAYYCIIVGCELFVALYTVLLPFVLTDLLKIFLTILFSDRVRRYLYKN